MDRTLILSLLAGLFNAGNDLIFKSTSKGDRNRILSFYLTASAISAALAAVLSAVLGTAGSLLTAVNVVYGLLAGVLSFFVYLFYVWSFSGGDTPLAVTVYRLNLIPGLILAVWFLGETLSPVRVAAIALSVLSIILLSGLRPGKGPSQGKWKPLLYSLAACVLGGVLTLVNKVAVDHGAASVSLAFWRFLTVGGCALAYMGMTKSVSIRPETLLPGALSGALMLAAIYATLEALKSGNVAFVIPVMQILTIVAVSVVSWTLLRERATRCKLLGILGAVAAVVLINW